MAKSKNHTAHNQNKKGALKLAIRDEHSDDSKAGKTRDGGTSMLGLEGLIGIAGAVEATTV